ncbi:hypothetical protein ACFY3M_42365 [Streptomyces mirabilis]|uniref:hypothetical protein n=1 Tax=Streptomyces mirabilis TaxID=68239 RepID=UPI00369166E7
MALTDTDVRQAPVPCQRRRSRHRHDDEAESLTASVGSVAGRSLGLDLPLGTTPGRTYCRAAARSALTRGADFPADAVLFLHNPADRGVAIDLGRRPGAGPYFGEIFGDQPYGGRDSSPPPPPT